MTCTEKKERNVKWETIKEREERERNAYRIIKNIHKCYSTKHIYGDLIYFNYRETREKENFVYSIELW